MLSLVVVEVGAFEHLLIVLARLDESSCRRFGMFACLLGWPACLLVLSCSALLRKYYRTPFIIQAPLATAADPNIGQNWAPCLKQL